MAAAPRPAAILELWSRARLLSLARAGGAGPDHCLFVFLDVRQAVDDTAAEFHELRSLADPAPPFKRAMADPPPRCQLDLVYACRLHFRFLSFWLVGMRHNEGAGGKYYQGYTGRSAKRRALRCRFLNREILRWRGFTCEYEGVLARCGAYFEQVCRTALSLRHYHVTNSPQREIRAKISFCFKGV